ncbi:hypothetical protein EDD11_000994, partial [Mortierella claussenii]
IATDCRHVTSRPILQEYLEDKLGEDVDILDDLNKVGNHCLSWFMYTNKEQKIRCKIYNKFVQMLESAEKILESVKEQIQDCPTFSVPYKEYW